MTRLETTRGGRPMKHGTVSAYNNHGCRCAECTRAWADYMRDRMRKYRADKKKKKTQGVKINLSQ